MAKKYLSIEEAAEQLGIPKEELNRLRSRGDIRGFSDRGTFKFKEEDVEELGRRLQPSSEPDIQMLDGEDDGSVLDDEPATGDDDAPSIIRRLSAGGGGSGDDDSDPMGSIFDDFGNNDLGSSDSDVRLVMDERLDAKHSSDPDVMLDMGESDSDVRLTNDDSDSDVKINLGDSDSDVRLASDSRLGEGSVLKMSFSDSDSDVRLDDSGGRGLGRPDSDSDVQLSPSSVHKGPKPDSDSDVMLVSDDDDDSDVHLTNESGILIDSQSDSDVRLVTDDSDSDVRLLDEPRLGSGPSRIMSDRDSGSGMLKKGSGIGLDLDNDSGIRGSSSVLLDDNDISLGEGSGISLTGDSGVALSGRSGIALDRAADSGVSLEKGAEVDSGLSLFSDDEDDGITLAGDSGIALQSDEADDSGIALNLEDEDDGLTLGDTMADSGIALKDDDDDLDLNLTETMPAMKIPAGQNKTKAKSGMDDTMLEVPSLEMDSDEEEESDFEIGAADGGSTGGDTSVLLFDDEDETDDVGAAMVKKKPIEDDEEGETFEFNEGDDEEEVSADDDLDGEVFEGDEAFGDDDSEFGESASDFETVAAKAPTMVGTVEYPWGGLTVSFLAASTICMVLCGMASIDLVRSIWGWQSTGYSPANGWLIEMLGGIMK